jgi:hypothetical protein
MKDEPPVTGTTTGQPQTARAQEDEWIHTPTEDRYAAATRMAVDARYVRARLAASRTIALANTLADRDMLITAPEGDLMWLLWDQPRTRQTFADPHPLDYPGGQPAPSEYPAAPSQPHAATPPATPATQPSTPPSTPA